MFGEQGGGELVGEMRVIDGVFADRGSSERCEVAAGVERAAQVSRDRADVHALA